MKKINAIENSKITLPYNIIVILGKVIIGIFTSSFFMIINAFYSVGITSAKCLTLKTDLDIKNIKESNIYDKRMLAYNNYKTIGIIILVSSIFYTTYSVKNFFWPSNTEYSLIAGLVIAIVTFVELTISIIGIVLAKKRENVVYETMKLINLVSSFIALVLTQTALLSFSHTGDTSVYNGISGLIFGSLSIIVGVYMIVHSHFAVKGLELQYIRKSDIVI